MTPVRLEPAALRSRVKHSTTEPLHSHFVVLKIMKIHGLKDSDSNIIIILEHENRSVLWSGRYILSHTSNAKCFRNVTLINIRGLAVIIVPFRGYGRLSLNQVLLKRE